MAAERPQSFGSLELHLVASMEETTARQAANNPFRILVLGDFSGGKSRGRLRSRGELAALRPIPVDRDTIDELPGRLGAALELNLGEGTTPLALRFDELDDFHPDRLVDRLALFGRLRKLRRELDNDRTCNSAAAEIRDLLAGPSASDVPAPPSVPSPATGLLDQVLEATAPAAPVPAATSDPGLAAFVRSIAAPHLLRPEPPQQAELIAAVDDLLTALMRAVLHHPDFQALEATWRGLDFLLARLTTDDQLQVFLLDCTDRELAADLLAADDLATSELYRLLVREAGELPGTEPWAVVAGCFTFSADREAAAILGRMARLCARAGAPFLAGADRSLPDHSDWAALRRLPEATWLGLVRPGFLLRLPYGAATEPIDRFGFEETEGEPPLAAYLWGSPALACACLLGQAFSERGWQLTTGEVRDLENLPLHVVTSGGERRTLPCTGELLSETEALQLLDQGLMVLLSFRDQDRIRLARCQSIADPPTRLAGPWK